jgi:hypothetical protein
MDYLLYWKTFWSENAGRPASTRDWFTDQKWLWQKVERGDRLWIVVAAPKDADGQWRLRGRLEVAKADPRVRRSPFKYRIAGSREGSLTFDVAEKQRDVGPVLKRLAFSSGRRLKLRGRAIGQAIRNARRLTPEDAARLEDFSEGLERE